MALFEMCVGDGQEGVTIETFKTSLARWLEDFAEFEHTLSTAEATHKERAELRTEMDNIEATLQSRWFAAFMGFWQRLRTEAEQALADGLPVVEAQERLLPFTALWEGLRQPLSELAQHYGFPFAEEVALVLEHEGSLAIRLNTIQQWLDSATGAHFSSALPRELPPLSDWSWQPPTLNLALAIELQMLDLRIISSPPDEILRGLAGLSGRKHPEAKVILTVQEVATITSLAERCGPSAIFLPALGWASQILGEGQQAELKSLIRRTVRNDAWRLPESIIHDGRYGAEIALVSGVASEFPADIPLANRLHIEYHCDRNARPRDDLRPWRELLDLGPFGAWLFAGWLELNGIAVNEQIIRGLYANPEADELSYNLALPMIAMRTACELDLFTAVGGRERSSGEVARMLQTDERATDRLMNVLCALGLLAQSDGRRAGSRWAVSVGGT
ncbi:MAG: hypothetical protein NTY38_13050 [Acidobacteria bacterium]|nr:hypothetical protein [Acidobacteriota bacterium]